MLTLLACLLGPPALAETSPHLSLPGAPALGDYQVELLPTWINRDADLTRGYALLSEFRFEEALPVLHRAAARPGAPAALAAEAWVLAGYAHLNLRRPDEAIAALEKALELKPDHALAHFFLASEYYLDGRVDLQNQHLREAIQLEPKFVAARRMLAESYADQGNTGGAVEQYRKIVELLPRSGYYAFLLYRAEDADGRYERAEEALEKLIALEPAFDLNYSRLGALRLKRARAAATEEERETHLRQAEEAFEELARRAPDTYRPHLGKAQVLLERGDLEGAERAAARAAGLAPDNPEVASLKEDLDRERSERRSRAMRQAGLVGLLTLLLLMLVVSVRQARRRQEVLSILSRFHSGVDQVYELDEFTGFCLDFLGQALGLERAALLLYHRQENRLAEAAGLAPAEEPMRVVTGTDVTNWLLGERRWLLPVDTLPGDLAFEEAFPSLSERLAHHRYNLLVPLRERAALLGFLALRWPPGERPPEDPEDLLLPLSQAVAQAIERLHLYESSLQDEMTRLSNRRHFLQTLSLELRRADRYGQPCSVVTFDIDDFKRVNDTYGHEQGDQLLRELAEMIRLNVREGIDTAARTGGEEFTLLLPATSTARAVATADRLRVTCEEHRFTGVDRPIRITLSMGVATYPDHATSERDLLSLADQAQYAAKRGGKNRVCAAGQIPAADGAAPLLGARVGDLNVLDPDTGLYNAGFLALRLSDELRRSTRSQQPFSLLTLGLEGDPSPEALRRAAVLIREGCREGIDVPARLENGDMAVLAPEVDDDRACALAARLCQALRERALPAGHPGGARPAEPADRCAPPARDPEGNPMAVAAGVATWPLVPGPIETLLEASGAAMRRARAEGLEVAAAAPGRPTAGPGPAPA